MVGEFSKGVGASSRPYRDFSRHLSYPAAQPSTSVCRLVIAFASRAFLIVVAGIWWLLTLDD
jgi:hypothetical protein